MDVPDRDAVEVHSVAAQPPLPKVKIKDKSHPVAPSLSDVIFLQAVKFASFEIALEHGAPWKMSSIKVRFDVCHIWITNMHGCCVHALYNTIALL